MHEHGKIDYVEFPAKSLSATKTFFETVFGWSFVDYGPTYSSFSGQGLDGGFYEAAAIPSGEHPKRRVRNCSWWKMCSDERVVYRGD